MRRPLASVKSLFVLRAAEPCDSCEAIVASTNLGAPSSRLRPLFFPLFLFVPDRTLCTALQIVLQCTVFPLHESVSRHGRDSDNCKYMRSRPVSLPRCHREGCRVPFSRLSLSLSFILSFRRPFRLLAFSHQLRFRHSVLYIRQLTDYVSPQFSRPRLRSALRLRTVSAPHSTLLTILRPTFDRDLPRLRLHAFSSASFRAKLQVRAVASLNPETRADQAFCQASLHTLRSQGSRFTTIRLRHARTTLGLDSRWPQRKVSCCWF